MVVGDVKFTGAALCSLTGLWQTLFVMFLYQEKYHSMIQVCCHLKKVMFLLGKTFGFITQIYLCLAGFVCGSHI